MCTIYNDDCNINDFTEAFDSSKIFFCKTHTTVHVCEGKTCRTELIENDMERCMVSGMMKQTLLPLLTFEKVDTVTTDDTDLHHSQFNFLQNLFIDCDLSLDRLQKLYQFVVHQQREEKVSFENLAKLTAYIVRQKLDTNIKLGSVRKKKKINRRKRLLERKLINKFGEHF